MDALKAFEVILKRLPQEDFVSAFWKLQKLRGKTFVLGEGGILKEIYVWTPSTMEFMDG